MSEHAWLQNVVVYLVGFAGTGKLTIATELAKMIDAKIVDNHWINNPIFGLIDSDGVSPLPPGVWDQTARVRKAVLETIATISRPDMNFIFTHEGLAGEPADEKIYSDIRA